MKVDLFIKETKYLFDQPGSQFSVVIGNQSADLDSIASAISLAFYLNQTKISPNYFIPIINSTRSVLASKKSCMYMFDQLSISLDDLIYLGDLKRERIRQVYLVDHNELDTRESELVDLVHGVIDHHLDKGGFKGVEMRCIDTRVGSNASLVVSLMSQKGLDLDSSMANMLLFPILEDTSNLTRITHQIDADAVEYLMRFASLDRHKLYSNLDKLKFSIDGSEPVGELLRQDYKLYAGEWAMSSLTIGLIEWIRRPGNLGQAIEFIEENKLKFFGILSFHRQNEEFKRDLILFGDEAMIRKFVDLNLTTLSQVECGGTMNMSYAIFKVNDASLSRKYWQPILEKFLNCRDSS
jgi:exopolyphosphatase